MRAIPNDPREVPNMPHPIDTATLTERTMLKIGRGENVDNVKVVRERSAGAMTFEVDGRRVPHAALWYAMKQVNGDFRRLEINADLSIDILNQPHH